MFFSPTQHFLTLFLQHFKVFWFSVFPQLVQKFWFFSSTYYFLHLPLPPPRPSLSLPFFFALFTHTLKNREKITLFRFVHAPLCAVSLLLSFSKVEMAHNVGSAAFRHVCYTIILLFNYGTKKRSSLSLFLSVFSLPLCVLSKQFSPLSVKKFSMSWVFLVGFNAEMKMKFDEFFLLKFSPCLFKGKNGCPAHLLCFVNKYNHKSR